MSASKGLPSSNASGDAKSATPPTHCETVLDALIDSHTMGIQRVVENREFLSRSSRKSPRITRAKIIVAIPWGIHRLPARVSDRKRGVISGRGSGGAGEWSWDCLALS